MLNKKYYTLLQRAKIHPLLKVQVRRKVKQAKDLELVLLHSIIQQELCERGYYEQKK